MYEAYYGFSEKPFSLLPDPDFLFFSGKHRSAFSVLEYSLAGQAGFTVISGEVGSGKTTLLQSFMGQIDDSSTVGLISNTPRPFENLLQWIFLAFDLDYHGKDKIELYHLFSDFLISEYAAGRRCVLIIDEAQNLEAEPLEELRMLSNVNANKDLLLQIILVGQPELNETLSRPELRQFAQRVAISYKLQALNLDETHAYIRHRLGKAGGDPFLFSDAACDAVFHFSDGVPRLINGVCDIALVYGFGEEKDRIDLDMMLAVLDDRDQSGIGQDGVQVDKAVRSIEIEALGAGRIKRIVKENKLIEIPETLGSDDLISEYDQKESEYARLDLSDVAPKPRGIQKNLFFDENGPRQDLPGVNPGYRGGSVPSRRTTSEREIPKPVGPDGSAGTAQDGSAEAVPSGSEARELAPDFAVRPDAVVREVAPRKKGYLWGIALLFMAILAIGYWLVFMPTGPESPRFGAKMPYIPNTGEGGGLLQRNEKTRALSETAAPDKEQSARDAAEAAARQAAEEAASLAIQAAARRRVEEAARRAAQKATEEATQRAAEEAVRVATQRAAEEAARTKEALEATRVATRRQAEEVARKTAQEQARRKADAARQASVGQEQTAAIQAIDDFKAGVEAFRRSEFERAIARLSPAIASGKLPKSELATAYRRRGESYVGSKRFKMAVADYTELVRLRPRDPVAYNSLGYAYNKMGQGAQALAETTRAIEISPGYAYAYSNRCWAYQKLGQQENAIADCRRALELNAKLDFARKSLRRMGALP